MRRASWLFGVVLVPLLAATLVTSGSATAASPPNYPIGSFTTAVAAQVSEATSMPPGMDIWSCVPSAAHPYPVILLHGTLFNESLTWQTLSPELADAGYCVYGFNYGAGPYTAGHTYAEGDIATSAQQLADFVFYVLEATHARQVDIVGHSQGGMMPSYYIKYLHGASKVHMLIGLAPSNNGTTLDGTDALFAVAHEVGLDPLTLAGCLACTQQINGSDGDFITNLNAGGIVPGPKYVVIESRYDEVVTPYQSAFLSGPDVQNILLQNQCSLDFTEHIGIVYDPVALQDVVNALGPDLPSFQPVCSFVPPVIG